MSPEVRLRRAVPADVALFFAHQFEPLPSAEANETARSHFLERWRRQLADSAMDIRTIEAGEDVAGYVACFEQDGTASLAYWLGPEFRGHGIGGLALGLFLNELTIRPLFARVDSHNVASLRLLERKGFLPVEAQPGPSGAPEIVMRLDTLPA